MDAPPANDVVFEGPGTKIVCLPNRVEFFVDPRRGSPLPLLLAFITMIVSVVIGLISLGKGHLWLGLLCLSSLTASLIYAMRFSRNMASSLEERTPEFIADLDDGTLRDAEGQVLCSLRRLRLRRTFDPKSALAGSNVLVALGGGTWHKIFHAKGGFGVSAQLDEIEAALKLRFDASPDPQA